MTEPQHFLFDLPPQGYPEAGRLNEEWYPGVSEHWQAASSTRSVDPLFGIRAIVIHAAGGTDSAGAMAVLKGHARSWHWLVPDEAEAQHGRFVWACIPETRAARHVADGRWHAAVNGGRRRVDQWSLGIRIVNREGDGATQPYSDWQVRATAGIVRHCWSRYPNLRHVVSAAALDPAAGSSPGAHFPWLTFKDLVLRSGRHSRAVPEIGAATPMRLLQARTRPG